MSDSRLPLAAAEARVLGVLVEKQHTVPDTYPLSLNALVAGCNQKTSREPVMELSESYVLTALDNLRSGDWVVESSGSRVSRYSHNIGRVLNLPAQSVALLATLMLRGPQTSAELRNNSERLYKFADQSSVEAFLEELSQRPAGSLVVMLPKAAGSREHRWAHLLCGEPVMASATPHDLRDADEIAALRAEVAMLREQMAVLQARVEELGGGKA
ncbi:MAG: YceH family protein [Moraxellaceae bacterium]|nr:YceH family protein [Moraxellaceae bacterium]